MPMGRIPGSFRHAHQARGLELFVDPVDPMGRRVGRILASIQQDLDEGCTALVRQILRGPRELYRLEIERPDMAYQRTTILDRDTLTALLEQTSEESLRERFTFREPTGPAR